MLAIVNGLDTFDAWLFYSLHWADIAVTAIIGWSALRMLWDTYGC